MNRVYKSYKQYTENQSQLNANEIATNEHGFHLDRIIYDAVKSNHKKSISLLPLLKQLRDQENKIASKVDKENTDFTTQLQQEQILRCSDCHK